VGRKSIASVYPGSQERSDRTMIKASNRGRRIPNNKSTDVSVNHSNEKPNNHSTMSSSTRKCHSVLLLFAVFVALTAYLHMRATLLFSRNYMKELGPLISFSATDNSSAARKEQVTARRRQVIEKHKLRYNDAALALQEAAVDTLNECGNTERWLKSSRYGNFDDDLLTNDLAKRMILDLKNVLVPDSGIMPTVVNQTICHDKSRFRTETSISSDDKTVRNWAIRLIYLALHYHQHRLAVPEATQRYSDNMACGREQMEEKFGVGVFDYECPDAKYVVMPLAGNGLGANVRGGTVVAFLIGLLTNRIVIFVNNAEQGGDYLESEWPLVSCPRMDYQCFFWPTTPCTLTQDEIGNAYVLTPGEYRGLLRRGVIPKDIDHHKVWTFNSQFLPVTDLPGGSSRRIYDYAQTLISAVPEADNPEYVAMLKKAAETILVRDDDIDGYNYAARSLKVHHALVFYSMRPNPRSASELDSIMNDIIPKDFEPESAFGLPIRGTYHLGKTSTYFPNGFLNKLSILLFFLGSDKCGKESECLTFDQYMQVTSTEWAKHQNATGTKDDPIVVFTTESKNVVKEQKTFVSENGGLNYPFKFNFVTNTQDVTPDTGFMKQKGTLLIIIIYLFACKTCPAGTKCDLTVFLSPIL